MALGKTVQDLILVFNTGLIAVVIWYYTGVYVYPDLYTIDLSVIDLLTHFAIPIQIIAVALGYLELWVWKKHKDNNDVM